MRSHSDDRRSERTTRSAADRPRSTAAPNGGQGTASPGSDRLVALASVVSATATIQRKPVPAPTADDQGRFYDDFLAQYVRVIQSLPGIRGQVWLVLEDLAGQHDQWLYQPADGTIPEHYTRFAGLDSYQRRLKAADAERAEQRYRESQERPGFAYRLANAGRKDVTTAIVRALKADWRRLGDNIASRAAVIFPALDRAFQKERIEPSPDLLKKINDATEPLAAAKIGELETKRASEALSELEYAADITSADLQGTAPLLHPMVLGAKGPEWSPDQHADIAPETIHGRLPALEVIRLEVDAYYQTADGVLHLDEVKDTPSALATKAIDGDQIRRQVQWLKLPVFPPNSTREFTKRVGYFAQAPGPGFDAVLDPGVIENLKLIERAQGGGLAFIRIGRRHLSIRDLQVMYDGAIQWLGESSKFFEKEKMRPSAGARLYFGDIETAARTLTMPPKKPGEPQ